MGFHRSNFGVKSRVEAPGPMRVPRIPRPHWAEAACLHAGALSRFAPQVVLVEIFEASGGSIFLTKESRI